MICRSVVAAPQLDRGSRTLCQLVDSVNPDICHGNTAVYSLVHTLEWNGMEFITVMHQILNSGLSSIDAEYC